MQKQIDSVREFHRHVGAAVAAEPRLLGHDKVVCAEVARALRSLCGARGETTTKADELLGRVRMELEELAEWIESHVADDLVKVADAWADRCYLLFGDAVATGLPVEEVFREVHRSNMTKSAAHPSTGKAVKSDRYVAPSIAIGAVPLGLGTTVGEGGLE
jgi:predicted HAD superfamily Cof-like phosphohydrolase